MWRALLCQLCAGSQLAITRVMASCDNELSRVNGVSGMTGWLVANNIIDDLHASLIQPAMLAGEAASGAASARISPGVLAFSARYIFR